MHNMRESSNLCTRFNSTSDIKKGRKSLIPFSHNSCEVLMQLCSGDAREVL